MLTGRGRYVSDWQFPGQAHGCFVRSDRAHAEILGIERRTLYNKAKRLGIDFGSL